VIEEAKRKKVNEFITENQVKVEAYSTQTSTRGRVFGHLRPDLFVLDDVETSTTKLSYPITHKIIQHIDEMKAGLGVSGAILYLGNYITEDGVIAHILDILKNNPKAVVRFIPAVDLKGKIAWQGKYVKTNKEAAEINRMIENREKVKVSLEAKEASLTPPVYATEMMNNPSKSADYVFNRDKIKELMLSAREPVREVGGLKMWAEFNPRHRYAGGVDTAEGIGQDSNADVIIDFTCKPNVVVATFESNLVDPVMFASHIKRHGDIFGTCFYVVELQQTGYATIAELVNLGYTFMYQREVKNKITNKMQKEFGWRSTTGAKHEVIAQFVNAVHDGELVIWDLALLEECHKYRLQDLRLLRAVEGVTRHFDKLQAAALAWEGRRWAELPKKDSGIYKSKQKKYVG
jgi:hypothetical protein